MANIKSVFAQEILDSRANPTIETTIVLDNDVVATSAVPSGASTGALEAFELRDNDPKKFNGKSVRKAVDNVNNIIGPKIIDMNSKNQEKIDKLMIELDGTENKSKLGANAILSVSQAVCKTGAKTESLSLFKYIKDYLVLNQNKPKIPIPLFNMIGGGKHASNNLSFQEFLVIPASSKSYSDGLEIGVNIYHTLKNLLHEKNLSTLNSDEGGFGPALSSEQVAVGFLKEAIEKSSCGFNFDAFLGLDVAATSFKVTNGYKIIDKESILTSQQLVDYYKTLLEQFGLIYIEDPMAEDDIEGWHLMFNAFNSKTLVVGDDLTVTNPKRLEMAVTEKLINAMIIKPNQIGTVTETINVCKMAKSKGVKIAVAHRSGETIDSFIADFAVGVDAEYSKFGAPARERIAKYSRLLEIEKEINKS